MKSPWHLWLIGIVTLVWNAGGAFDFFMTVTKNDAYMGNFTPEQLDYFYSFPTWTMVTWGIGTWGAVIASLLLLLRSRFALWAFVLSFGGMIATSLYTYVLADVSMTEITGTGALALSVVIFIVALLLVWYANRMLNAGYLR